MIATLGKSLAYRIFGAIVVITALLAGLDLVGKGEYPMSSEEERQASSNKLKNWLFLPALLIPLVTVIGTVFLKGVSIGGVFLLDQKYLTIAALCLACIITLLVGWKLTGSLPPIQTFSGHYRLGCNFATNARYVRWGICGGKHRGVDTKSCGIVY